MFDFVVTYLGFLKRIPILPHVFDTFLKLHCIIFNNKIAGYVEEIEAIVSEWEGVSLSLHKYGGLQFNLGTKEIGHLHSNGLLDILFDKKNREELVSKGMVEEHHIFKDSGWISLYIKSKEDVDKAVDLLRLSFLKHIKKDK